MSWLFSQALGEEYSAATCSDGEPFAQLNVMPTQHPFWRNDKTMDICTRSPFGLTSRRLTDDRGAALLTWFLVGFPVRICPSPDEVPDLTENAAVCGESLRGSLAKYDQHTHSLKIAQLSLLEDSTECSVTLPRSGTMRNGECYQRQTLERRTRGSGCGLLPTPTASAMPCEGTVRIMRKQWLEGNYTLEEASAIAGRDVRKSQGKVPEWFPTPCARDYKGARTDEAMAETGRSQATNSLPDFLASIGQRGQMNPVFREWLMGWPLEWTGLKPLETAKFLEWQQAHSFNCKPD